VRYEHDLHAKSKAIPATNLETYVSVLLVRYEHHLYIKSKAIPVTGRGATLRCVFCQVHTSSTYKSVKLFPLRALESCKVVKYPGQLIS
jgi:hypothetical protein